MPLLVASVAFNYVIGSLLILRRFRVVPRPVVLNNRG